MQAGWEGMLARARRLVEARARELARVMPTEFARQFFKNVYCKFAIALATRFHKLAAIMLHGESTAYRSFSGLRPGFTTACVSSTSSA